MLDVAAVMLTMIGLLQNYKNTNNQAKKQEYLSESIEKITPILDLLIDAKKIHDESEKYLLSAEDTFNTLSNNKTEPYKLQKKSQIIIALKAEFIKSFNIERVDLVKSETLKGLPASETHNLKIIIQDHPHFKQSIKETTSSFINYEKFCTDGIFTGPFTKCVNSIKHNLTESRRYADSLIFNIIPIVSFLFYKMKSATKGTA
ncbi:hypothetical protein [Dethiosulfatarculus sandiegensis]|uniref:Uncharacterized protein n=1 Tax=Dethiosulfatarculus sandiegensis TaxID=1429043 RepID=A0A0D2IXM8_9BACT|nr:hypothetical protein [Dethiosulfatarculus sandiegensis]KIX10814.1 hypothetical protein X474_28110 [Dethiosulfatarculus sandiegensis]